MISLIRIALIMLIIYLIQRAFADKKSAGGTEPGTRINEPKPKKNKLPKEIGEYVDYEDVQK